MVAKAEEKLASMMAAGPSIGAALLTVAAWPALFGIYIPLGIGFIVLVQLNYAIAPRLPVLFKL